MTPDDVARSYDRIAARWVGPEFDRRNGVAQHERAIAFVTGRGPALDVGCGCSGRIIELLTRHGFVPEGLDLSTEMLRRARERHPAVVFHHADVCRWTPPRAYHLISAWDSIWHVPLDRQPAMLRTLCGALAPGGVLIFTSGGVEEPDERRDAAMGVPMYHATPGVPGILAILQDAGCALRHFEYDQPPHAHVYLIAQRPAPAAPPAPGAAAGARETAGG